MKSLSQKKGFTLIELLVVIAIIGLLSSVVFASLNSARGKARDARRMADVKQIQTALELYYDANNSYPISSWLYSNDSSWNTLQTALAPYMPSLPKDPLNGYIWSGYGYWYYANAYGGAGQWYMILYRQENANTSVSAQDGVIACDGTRFDYGGSATPSYVTLGGSCAR